MENIKKTENMKYVFIPGTNMVPTNYKAKQQYNLLTKTLK